MTPPRLLFYAGGGPVAAGIRWFTRGEFAHVAVWYPDVLVVRPGDSPSAVRGEIVEAREGRGVIRSPATHDRIAGAALACALPPVTWDAELEAHRWLEAQVGKRYDYKGVAGFVTRATQSERRASGRWFCSELAAALCAKRGVPLLATDSWKISPTVLAWSPLLVPVAVDGA